MLLCSPELHQKVCGAKVSALESPPTPNHFFPLDGQLRVSLVCMCVREEPLCHLICQDFVYRHFPPESAATAFRSPNQGGQPFLPCLERKPGWFPSVLTRFGCFWQFNKLLTRPRGAPPEGLTVRRGGGSQRREKERSELIPSVR